MRQRAPPEPRHLSPKATELTHSIEAMSVHKESADLPSKRRWIIMSVLWVALFAVFAWVVVARWGLSFWPSVALFTVYTVGMAVPLGVALGYFVPRGIAARRERGSKSS